MLSELIDIESVELTFLDSAFLGFTSRRHDFILSRSPFAMGLAEIPFCPLHRRPLYIGYPVFTPRGSGKDLGVMGLKLWGLSGFESMP